MPKYNVFKERAFKMRSAGYSYNMISLKLGVAKSTLSNWFKDKPFLPNDKTLKRIQRGSIKSAQTLHNKKVHEILKFRKNGKTDIGALTKRDLLILGLGLYMGEGSKTYEIVRIINSDPNIVSLAIRWFKEIFNISNENLTIRIHLYPDNDIKKSIDFWQGVTKLPYSNFGRSSIDRRGDKSKFKKRKLPYGTAHITILSKGDPEKGVRLHRKIMGLIEGVLSQ